MGCANVEQRNKKYQRGYFAQVIKIIMCPAAVYAFSYVEDSLACTIRSVYSRAHMYKCAKIVL